MPMQMRHTSEAFSGEVESSAYLPSAEGKFIQFWLYFYRICQYLRMGIIKISCLRNTQLLLFCIYQNTRLRYLGLLPHDTKASPMPPFLQNPFYFKEVFRI